MEPIDAPPGAWFETEGPPPFVGRMTVPEAHVGAVVGHADNVAYLAWLDRAAELHADTLGYTRAAMLERGVMWFVARHEIDYRAEAHGGDELLVATRVRDVRGPKSWRDSVILRPADDRVVCRAATLWVLVDLATRRPRRFDAVMASAFGHPAAVEARSR